MLHDDRKELFEYVFAVALNVLFLGVAALVLWPLGRAAMALELAKGYAIFWGVLLLTAAALIFVRRLLRIDIDSHFDAYVMSALALSALLQIGWCAFAAVTVDTFAATATGWIAAVLYVVGALACYVAYVAVSAFYMGSLYRMVNLGIALASYIVFSVWPAAGHALYFWASSRSISLTTFGSLGVTALS